MDGWRWVWETTETRSPHIPMDAGVGFREPKNAGCGRIAGTCELRTQSYNLVVVPSPRLEDIETSLGT